MGGLVRRSAKIAGSRVLEVGPLPPPTGGIQTGILQLLESSLGQRYFVGIVNTSSGRAPAYQGRLDIVNVFHSIRQTVSLIHQVVLLRPDFVQIDTSWRLGLLKGCWFAVVARAMGRQVIISIHTPYRGQVVPSPVRGLVGNVLRRAAAVRVLSESWKEYFEQEFGLQNLRVIPNGVPVPVLADTRGSGNGDGVRVILSVGTLGKRKGTYELLKALAVLVKRNLRVRLDLAGPWESRQAAEELMELSDRLGIRSTVRFHGEVSDRDTLASLYRGADLFALPSYGEGLPRAAIEAMSYGLPVVVTPVGALGELVQDGVNGLLVEPGQVRPLAEALEQLISDTVLRDRLGSAARQTVIQQYSLDVEIAGWESLYESIARKRKEAWVAPVNG